jgi:hypothetical protein
MNVLHQSLDQVSRDAEVEKVATGEEETSVLPVVAADGSKGMCARSFRNSGPHHNQTFAVAQTQAADKPCCAVCDKAVTLPCWLCVHCLQGGMWEHPSRK